MPLNINAYLAGALLLIVGVLPHLMRQNAHFGLFYIVCHSAINERGTVIIVGLDGSHFPISLHNTFCQCVVLSRLVAFIA